LKKVIPLEMLAVFARNGASSYSRKGIIKIRLKERTMGDTRLLELLESVE
jgi:hypothetical protein